jgi:CDGSH-type Zn-finger protein
MMSENETTPHKRIMIVKNGPYLVQGEIPLVRKTQVVSERGEPLTWKKEGAIKTEPGEYALCRCGYSGQHPFCDGTHRRIGFDGTECADEGSSIARQVPLGGTRILVKKDRTLCMDAGFCGLRNVSLAQFLAVSNTTQARSIIMAMIERCPSGALTYQIAEGDGEIEPDLPEQIADTIEITAAGPIAGPLWVTGGIAVERSDGLPLETRNRVTLCNCGLSRNKPLCDGTHRHDMHNHSRQRS